MEMEENFNLDDSSREMPDLHLNPTEFANKLKSCFSEYSLT
jgi:hypothetical protein